MAPKLLKKKDKREAEKKACELLKKVGLEDKGEGIVYECFETNDCTAYPSQYCVDNCNVPVEGLSVDNKYAWWLRSINPNSTTRVKWVKGESIYVKNMCYLRRT